MSSEHLHYISGSGIESVNYIKIHLIRLFLKDIKMILPDTILHF